MYTDQRFFRSRALEPIAGIGDVLFLLDQGGPIVRSGTPFWMIKSVEPVFGIGPHGVLLIWNQAAAAPAGYGTGVGNTALIPEAATGNIAAGGSAKCVNPKILQGAKQQLFQGRFTLKPLALTGPVVHDIEVQMALPGAAGKFGLFGGGGFYNMAEQLQDPSDVIVTPAQAANQTLPAAFPNLHPRDNANLSEFFVWEINGPTFTIFNNGSAALSGGSIGVRIWGFRYDLAPLVADSTWVNRWVYGQVTKAPPIDRAIPVVQTATFVGQGSY